MVRIIEFIGAERDYMVCSGEHKFSYWDEATFKKVVCKPHKTNFNLRSCELDIDYFPDEDAIDPVNTLLISFTKKIAKKDIIMSFEKVWKKLEENEE